jgi:PHD/YefM family antitoxin component YafN of YafNO toxin-antitoxin module
MELLVGDYHRVAIEASNVGLFVGKALGRLILPGAKTKRGPACAITNDLIKLECALGIAERHKASLEDDVYYARREVIRNDITRRLRKACAHLSDEDFKRLVERMTEQKLRGERNGSL